MESFWLEKTLMIIELSNYICFLLLSPLICKHMKSVPLLKKQSQKSSLASNSFYNQVRTQDTLGKSDQNLRKLNSYCYFCGVK